MTTLTAPLPTVDHEPAKQAAWERRWIVTFLALGVVARAVRYVLQFPLWEDECFLVYGIVTRDFAGLAGPLEYHQVAPILFLWVQKAAVTALGLSELSLRLFPLACSLIALGLFARIARQLLAGHARVIAVAVFAVSYPAIRYAAEAKPYGIDLTLTLAACALAVEWWITGRTRWLWWLAASTPLFMLLSYPALFVYGALSAVLLFLLRQRSAKPPAWAAWLFMNALMIGAFAVTLALAHAAYDDASRFQSNAYAPYFLPWTKPIEAMKWLATMLTGEAMAIPIGSGNGGSTVSLLLTILGLWVLCRSGRAAIAAMIIVPLMLHLIASAMQRYPFGGHVKFSMYLMPSVCVALGAGGAAMAGLWPQRLKRRAIAIALLMLSTLAAGSIVRDVIHPHKTRSDERYRAFARWLWFDLPHEGEVVCLKDDLKLTFSPPTFRDLSWSAMYLVNRQIVSPRAQRNQPPAWDKIAPAWPLYIAEYRDSTRPYDAAAQQKWLDSMQTRYRLVGTQAYPLTRYDKRERRLIKIDHVYLYKFVPR